MFAFYSNSNGEKKNLLNGAVKGKILGLCVYLCSHC